MRKQMLRDVVNKNAGKSLIGGHRVAGVTPGKASLRRITTPRNALASTNTTSQVDSTETDLMKQLDEMRRKLEAAQQEKEAAVEEARREKEAAQREKDEAISRAERLEISAEDAKRALQTTKQEHKQEIMHVKREVLKEEQERREREQALREQVSVFENDLNRARSAELAAVVKLDETEC